MLSNTLALNYKATPSLVHTSHSLGTYTYMHILSTILMAHLELSILHLSCLETSHQRVSKDMLYIGCFLVFAHCHPFLSFGSMS